MFDPEQLADSLIAIPNVVCVVLGGSRAAGTHRPDSDWDLGLYYEGSLDADHLRALGHAGQVFGTGEWSPLMDGGAWFDIDGTKVDVIYREVGAVQHWIDEAEAGRFKVELLGGFIAGFDTTVLVGEAAICTPIRGELPFAVTAYPEALRQSAPAAWRARRDFSRMYAEQHAERGDDVMVQAMRARAAIEEAHAVLAERGEWVLNEKGLLARAGLGSS
ncbi:MAG TPA: nucleotidyltransferase domain-containing protein [Acidimicrobiales bacterium]|nr:nucleotidyltransferase domain-containing protein [Acidimicrobiales bacterium]